MGKIADLIIKIGGDAYSFIASTKDVKKQLAGLNKDLKGFGKSMSKYFTVPITAAAGAAVYAADIQMKAEARLLVALKGREDVQKRLMKQAGELQSRTTLGDEVIIGQQAYLASLGMTEQQIGNVIEASAQLSAAMGTTLDGAVKNLAKTYGGLTGELGESIPAMKQFTVEQLKSGAAIDYVLNNYKGYAETIANTGLGALSQLKNSLGDLAEEVGYIIMPAVQKVASWLKDVVKWLQDLPPAAKKTIVVIGGLAAAAGPLALGLRSILKLLPLIGAGFAALTGPVGLVTMAIAAATAALVGFNAYAEASAKAKMSARAMEIVDSGMTVEQMIARREKILKDNADAMSKYRDASDRLNPMNSKSMASYAMNFGDNFRSKQQQGRTATWTHNEFQALNEAIRLKNQQVTLDADELTETITTGGKKAVGIIASLQQKLSELEEAKKNAFNTYEIHNINKELEETRRKLEAVQNAGQEGNIVKNADSIFGGGIKPLAFDPNAINPPESDWNAAAEAFVNNISNLKNKVSDTVIDFGLMLSDLMTNMAVNIGESIGNMLSGDGTVEDLMSSFGKMLGDFLVYLGKELIVVSKIVMKIKMALSSIFSNPWAAIAVGVGAIAIGTAMSNLFNKKAGKGVALAQGGLAYGPTMALVGDNRGAGSDPEVIAPLSKLRQYGLGRQSIEFVGGQFRLSGSDLLLSIRREDARVSYVNAMG